MHGKFTSGVLSNFAASSKFATVAKSNQIKALSGKVIFSRVSL